jgi:hypothetical protein
LNEFFIVNWRLIAGRQLILSEKSLVDFESGEAQKLTTFSTDCLNCRGNIFRFLTFCLEVCLRVDELFNLSVVELLCHGDDKFTFDGIGVVGAFWSDVAVKLGWLMDEWNFLDIQLKALF